MPGETDAAALIARVKADISQYEREMRRANQIMGSTASDMERKAGGAAQKTSRSMDMLGKAVAGVITVAALQKVGQFVDKLTQLDERAKQVRSNFANLLDGGDVGQGLQVLQQATGRGADNLFLMEASSRLMAVHLAESNAEAAELLRISSQLGKFSKGLTVEQSVNTLLPLLSNQSALRLDEFGLSGDRVKALQDKYEAAGMESGAAFKRAFVEEAQATLDAIGEQVVTETERLAAAKANLTTGLAQAAGQGLVGQAYQWVRGAVTDVMQFGGDYFQNVAERRAQIDEYVASLREMADAGVLSEQAYRDMTNGLVGLNAEIEFSMMSHEELEARIQGVQAEMPAVSAAFTDWETRIHGVDSATSALQARLEQMDGRRYVAELEVQTRITGQLAAGAEATGLGHLEYAQRVQQNEQMSRVQQWLNQREAERERERAASLAETAEAQRDYNYLIADEAGKLAMLQRELAGVTQGSEDWYRIQGDIWRLQNSGGGGGGGGASSVDHTAAMVRSAAESVFRASSVTDRDWWETETGQYQDKPDEYLRRLRSAMTDPGSQWKDLLGGRSGAEAQLYAVQQEELWRSGQWSQMGPGFDAEASRSAMIEQIIQKVNADRSRSAMIESLISDPRLQGLGMTASELTAATGTPMAAAGVEQMNTLVKAAGSVDVGRQLAESIDAQFRSTEDLWVAMGESAMTWFVGGFTSLAPEIATALARTLLGPLLDEMERTGVRARP
jgi:hypothetical protein